MARRKNVKRIDPRYFLNEGVVEQARVAINQEGPGSFGRVVSIDGTIDGQKFQLNNQLIYGDNKLRDMADWGYQPQVALRDALLRAQESGGLSVDGDIDVSNAKISVGDY